MELSRAVSPCCSDTTAPVLISDRFRLVFHAKQRATATMLLWLCIWEGDEVVVVIRDAWSDDTITSGPISPPVWPFFVSVSVQF
jgi:hypothetical protein